MIWNKLGFLSIICALALSCGPKGYNLNGSSIDPSLQTFSVDFIKNETGLNPQLSIQLTEKLKSKFQSETRLKMLANEGDYKFSGVIKEYAQFPITIAGSNNNTENQFKITVHIDVECKIKEKNFNKDYSFFKNFPAGTSFAAVESSYSQEILDNIVQQIYASVALDW